MGGEVEIVDLAGSSSDEEEQEQPQRQQPSRPDAQADSDMEGSSGSEDGDSQDEPGLPPGVRTPASCCCLPACWRC